MASTPGKEDQPHITTSTSTSSSIDPGITQVIAFLIKDFLSPLQVRSAVNEIICTKLTTSAKTILKIVQNALQVTTTTSTTASTTKAPAASSVSGVCYDNAMIEKYRKIRLANKIIHERIVQQPGAMDLLTSIGFVYDDTTINNNNNNNDKYLIFVPGENDINITLASFFCSTLQEELTQYEQIHTNTLQTLLQKKQHLQQNNQNYTFLSEEERKTRKKKAIAAKKAQKEERERAITRWKEDENDRIEKKERKEWMKKQNMEKVLPITPKIRKLNHEIPKDGVTNDDRTENNMDPMQSLQLLRAAAKANWEHKRGGGGGNNNQNGGEINTITNQINVIETDMDIDHPKHQVNDEEMIDDIHNIHNDGKMPAISSSSVDNTTTPTTITTSDVKDLSPSWEECLQHIPRCTSAPNIRETSVLNQKMGGDYNASTSSPKCFKRLFAELDELKTLLPSDKQCSAWLRFDEETPQYIRALLTAPLPGPSPYAGGVFTFDIYIPDDYPMNCPQVRIVTTGGGSVRFGPNLYACGKVCLSLLGTWEGPRWDPKNSSLHQVLVSIQSLMLGVEHPYFLEPGYGGWEANIKEGDFVSVGHTLQGGTVREETKLKPEVWMYEDRIRLGSIRYAMLDPLLLAARDVGSSSSTEIKPSVKNLEAFEDVIKAHFFHNGTATLATVAEWLNTTRPSGCDAQFAPTLQTLQKLFPQLQTAMGHVQPPSFAVLKTPAAVVSSSSTSATCKGGLNKEDATMKEEETSSSLHSNKNYTTDQARKSDIDRLRDRMQEAAAKNNFILAGMLQKEIQAAESYDKEINSLKAKIEEAASSGDYILAGTLQAKLKRKESEKQKRNMVDSFGSNSFRTIPQQGHQQAAPTQPSIPPFGQPNFDNSQQNDEDEEHYEEEMDVDESYNSSDDNWGSSYNNHSAYSHWGAGQQLGQTMNTTTTATEKFNNFDVSSTAKEVVPMDNSASKSDDKDSLIIPRLPVNEPCRVRVRLLETMNETLNEAFDSSEKLSTLYKFVKARIESKSNIDSTIPSARLTQLKGITNDYGSQAVGVQGGAFSNPSSEYGFTLVTPHPKREFNLEMYGSKTLKELGIYPSCTLIVMMCSSRGQVKRGILESKLGQANGMAMDLDGLGYEALQELGEKIGVATPGDGCYVGIDESQLDDVSILINAKEYLSQKSAQEGDTRCPICLGDFDAESDSQLRMLNSCGHTFHTSCLMTWLRTKTNCPVCKSSLTATDDQHEEMKKYRALG